MNKPIDLEYTAAPDQIETDWKQVAANQSETISNLEAALKEATELAATRWTYGAKTTEQYLKVRSALEQRAYRLEFGGLMKCDLCGGLAEKQGGAPLHAETCALYLAPAPVPALDWTRAETHLKEIVAMYSELMTAPNANPMFALVAVINPLAKRFANGERTQELYDDILSLE